MADLSNLKIKDTYQLLLQADASGNVQNLQGATPNPFIVNGNLRYVDGNQQADYYLKSDGTGNATWAQLTVSGDIYISAATMNDTVLQLHTTSGTTINVPVSYWSTDGSGNYSNSGLTGNVGIGTSTPGEKLTVEGNISASGDGYFNNVGIGTDSPGHKLSISGGALSITDDGSNAVTLTESGNGDFTIDAPDDIRLDAGGQDIVLRGASSQEFGRLTNSSADFIIRNITSDKDIIFKVNDGGVATEVMRIDGDVSRVGIGTTTPNEKLTVVGAISATTDLYFNAINGGTF